MHSLKVQVIWTTFAEVRGYQVPKMKQIQQIAALILHPGNPGKLFQIMFCFKLCYASKSHVLETVDNWVKNSSLHVLWNPVSKEPYIIIVSIKVCTLIKFPGRYSPGLKVGSTSGKRNQTSIENGLKVN